VDIQLIVNPIAGNKAFRSIKKIEGLLRKKASVRTFITEKKGDAEAFAKQISSKFVYNHSSLVTRYLSPVLMVAGGDGTFNEVINGLLSSEREGSFKSKIPLALIPLGTTNVLAKELGIPENIKGAIEVALTNTPRTISLGRIVTTRHSELVEESLVTRYFSLMAGIGFDGEAVFRVSNRTKKISGKGAYILSGIKTLMQYNPPLIEVKTTEGTFTGYTAVVGNARFYGGYFQIAPRADLTEPLLDLCLFKGKTRKDIIRFVIGVIRKRHLDFADVFYRKFSEMEITSQGKVHVQIDGDYFGTLPAKIDIVKDAVSMIFKPTSEVG